MSVFCVVLLQRDGAFKRFPNEARVGNATGFRSCLHCCQQWLRYAHIDLVVLLLEFKFCRFELREIEAGQVLSQKRFSLFIRFQLWNFLLHQAILVRRVFRIGGDSGTVGEKGFDPRNRKAMPLTLRAVPFIPIEPAKP